MSSFGRTTIVPGSAPFTPTAQVARVRQRIALAGMAFGSEAGEAGVTGVFHTQARHLAFLPAETLELDLLDPAERAFGDYELVEKIGQGGMGVVYRARQASLDREVAIKLLSAGPWASPEFIERFKREAQSAARMQHPNIVSIFEIGTHAELNYFSMQLVRGPSLAQVLAEKGPMAARDAARLLRTIAEAVDYAHRLGVLHLDLKPGNVLVDERGDPQVADFGLARRLDETLATEGEEISGTPSYMAPEQAQLRSHTLSPATDIYGLGAILYELLTGKPPFLGPTAHETLKRVVTDPPERPRSLKRSIPTDLEAICLKCLEKAPKQRYASARHLADDLGRFHDGRQVSARALNLIQRGFRWAKREPRVAAIGSALFLAIIAGLVATSIQWREAQSQARRALEAEASTRQRADELAQVSDFQAQMLGQVDPTQAGKLLTDAVVAKLDKALLDAGISERERAEQVASFTGLWSHVNATDAARELIDSTILTPAVAAIDQQFKDQPVVAAILLQVLADRYKDMGMYAAALAPQESAVAIRRRTLGEAHRDTLISINNVGYVYLGLGRQGDAERDFRLALEGRRRLLGNEHVDTIESMVNLGAALRGLGRLEETESYYREALELSRRTLGADHRNTISTINNMGALLHGQGRLAEAEPYWREALERSRRAWGEDHPFTITSVSNLGSLLLAQAKADEAASLIEEALRKRRAILGEENPQTLISLISMGDLLIAQGRPADALDLLVPHDAAIRIAFAGSNAHRIGSFLSMLGKARTRLREFAAAEANLLEASEIFVAVRGPTHRNTLACDSLIVTLYEEWHAATPGSGYGAKAREWRRISSGRAATGEQQPPATPSAG